MERYEGSTGFPETVMGFNQLSQLVSGHQQGASSRLPERNSGKQAVDRASARIQEMAKADKYAILKSQTICHAGVALELTYVIMYTLTPISFLPGHGDPPFRRVTTVIGTFGFSLSGDLRSRRYQQNWLHGWSSGIRLLFYPHCVRPYKPFKTLEETEVCPYLRTGSC